MRVTMLILGTVGAMNTQVGLLSATTPWTSTYTMNLPKLVAHQKSSSQVVVTKTHLPVFTQLILSWNAVRPREAGLFTFYGQLQDSASGSWGDWHRMIDWGDGLQRSHCNTHRGNTQNAYVRLEMLRGKKASGFRIKIVAHNGADLNNIHRLFVCISDMPAFKWESIYGEIYPLPAVVVHGVPTISQMKIKSPDAERMCSATSIAMLCSYVTKHHQDLLECGRCIYDRGLDGYGSWPFNIAHAYERCGGKCFFVVRRLTSFKTLHRYLQRGIPVAVSVRGALPTMPEGPTYKEGHIVVVVGWDPKTRMVYVNDPAFPRNREVRHAYPVNAFIKNWERSHRLAYVPEPVSTGKHG